MDDDFLQRLYSAESDFLVALESGAATLASYNEAWSALPGLLHTALKSGRVDNETLLLASSVASRVLNIANCYLNIKHREENLSTRLRVAFDAMLHKMEALKLNTHPESSLSDGPGIQSSILPTTPATDTGHPSPPFLGSAYRWLLDNLHNPYPTSEVKKRIAASSSFQVSSVNSWFTNARRRIGWTTLCRDRFSNCRADMMDAAYRALVKEDPQRILSPELRHAFVAMKVAAECLYPSTLTGGAFAEDLDAIAKDIASGESPGARESQVEQANSEKTARESYPSPDASITGTLVSTLDNSLTDKSEEEGVAPPIIAGHKRRRACLESVIESCSDSRPIKRLRASKTSPAYLPSPPTSTDDADTSVGGSPEPSPAQSVQLETSIVTPSRKRRLSDADAPGLSKRPRGTMATSDSYVAPDPLTRSNTNDEYSVDGWFNSNFDALFTLPPPVEATRPDSSASWDVELFRDYTVPGNSKRASNCASAPVDTHMPVPSDFTDLDHLLQSIAPPDMPAISYTASLNSSIPDMPPTTIDYWTSLLHDAEISEPNIYSTFPQYPIDSQPLPEIDLSMLQLPLTIPTSSSQAEIALKQAKLQQFHAMQEAVRQMEQELLSEGVIA